MLRVPAAYADEPEDGCDSVLGADELGPCRVHKRAYKGFRIVGFVYLNCRLFGFSVLGFSGLGGVQGCKNHIPHKFINCTKSRLRL